MTKRVTPERAAELLSLAEESFNDREWFEYEDFDHLIGDESMTFAELKWLRKNATVSVSVESKD